MLIPATSTENLHVPVTAPENVDITGSPPRLAILPVHNRSNPTVADWKTGAWNSDNEAVLLIGPDGGETTLTPGDYRVWVSFDPPGSETIVRLSGYLNVI
ncbi:hypothetical protein [Streptomyces scabiei]|uniref:hypothetical protein n=1 Tax=Streptomyces scabiei TaxID=1930 RepID=UPI0029A1CE9A|nr:hypothetical protein [Streptomyces scabiei]MDX3026730.1 hypothetical protein [Streptomyces scabiei]MDX3208074.1 hypothetical protein [Streptomyces scabiei]